MKSPSAWGRRIGLVAVVLLAFGCSPDSTGVTPPTTQPPPTTEPPLTSGSVVVNRSATLLTAVGQSRQLTAKTMNASGSTVNAAVEWSSSTPDQVSVDATGRITARAIGSAQIFARSGGITSPPVLVVVAEPQPGALVVTDAQVISVGAPLGLAPGEAAGVGTRYEVRLTGVPTPPTPGTVVLAAENAPVAGKVVSTRTESGALVVTLAFTRLGELFARYKINWSIDLATLPATAAQTWNGASATLASATSSNLPAAPLISQLINAVNCEASLAPVLASRTVQIAPTGSLQLDIIDEPGHTRRALVGQLKLVGTISLRLNAGFKFSGKCEAVVPIPIPIGGPLAVGILPVVRLGVGAGIEGQIFVTAGEIGETGELGVQVEVGWECGGPFPGCQTLPGLTAINKNTPKFEVFSAVSGMRFEVAGQFYFLAGLDAVIAMGINVPLVEAKIGPVQSVDLGFEEDQAILEQYASKYDLKVEGTIEPGSGLQKILNLISGPGINLTFQGKVSIPVSESPKGVLTVSQNRVNLSGQTVDMKVDLKNTDYFLIGYNVEHVELWQKRATESQFKVLKSFPITASNQTQFQYTWTPTTDDLGLNEFAVFVYTKFPVPGLEIADNSIQQVDVQCFSAYQQGNTPTAGANTCADTWQGTAKYFSPGELQIDASVTWVRDTTVEEVDGNVQYVATGTATVKFIQLENQGCSVSQTIFPIKGDFVRDNNFMLIDYGQTPAPFFIGSEIALIVTVSCPNQPSFLYPLGGIWAIGNGTIDQNGIIKGRNGAGNVYWEWSFKRP